MVCKKCGMELIEGIDICPYCGEDNHITEKQQILNDLGSLKMDVPEVDIEVNEKPQIEINKPIEDNDFYKTLNEVEDESKKETLETPNIDNYLNSEIILNNKKPINNNTEKELNDILASIDEHVNKLKEVTEPISNEEKINNDDTSNVDNVIDIVNNSNEENASFETKEEPQSIDINNIIGEIKTIDEQINNDIDSTLNLDEIKNDNQENVENTQPIETVQIEDLETDNSINTFENELNEPTYEEPVEISQPEINVETPVQSEPVTTEQPEVETTEDVEPQSSISKETPEAEEPINTEDNKTEELIDNSVEEENNISEEVSDENPNFEQEISIPQTEEQVVPTSEESQEIPNALNLENLLDDLKQVPVEESNEAENLVSDIVEQKQDETTRIDEVKNTEPSEIKVETQNLSDLIKESEENAKEQQVYINPVLDNVEPPSTPNIPTYLPPKEEIKFEMPETQVEEPAQTTNINDTNLNPSQTPILMPEDMNGNNVIVGKGIKTNEMLKDQMQEEKKSSGASVIILFILMIALGVGVAFAVSYIFNM